MSYFYVVDSLPRDWNALGDPLCPDCFNRGDYVALRGVSPTPDELTEFNCSRSWPCCMVTLVCDKCGRRQTERLPAPEME